MSKLSDSAFDTLKTIRKKARKVGFSKYFTDNELVYWYDFESGDVEEPVKSDIQELLDAGLLKNWNSEPDEYILTPAGENYTHTIPRSSTKITQNFSDIHNSNIANMSAHAHQALDLGSYSVEIQNEVALLLEAAKAKDSLRAKRIIDGLWVSAPSLILQLLQIGLALPGGQS